MKLIQEFSTAPEQLSRQVGQLERTASDAIDEAAKGADTRPHKVYARKSGHVCRAGDLVVCDLGLSIEILFARPTATQEGQRLVLLKTKPAGIITTRGLNCTINNVAFLSIGSVGAATFYAADGAWLAN